ncbi:MAG: hypothetical protein ACD_78C00336G0005 [uncultured bacterium (gcode 4)]|uniref:Uncharacterized protein n=1 Tax=uncultured bacterium (gcode 4) TaxID=1234023 RepID=K1XH48_9BACT|nr:MAG: hypothetical protein ACD_78C00336G0005 [uncultured bacterium (gcode 4)]
MNYACYYNNHREHNFSEMWKNDNIRMKSEYRSEPYDLYGERGTQGLNMKIEVISHFSNTVPLGTLALDRVVRPCP